MTKISLAILIPTLTERAHLCDRLQAALYKQIDALNVHDRVVILTNVDNKEKTTGQKRNELISDAVNCGAEYVAFFDDDDLPSKSYIQRQLEVCYSGADVGELWGQIYFSGKAGMPFHHSIEYSEWSQDRIKYKRNPNHLNCAKTSIVKDFKFRDISWGEDGNWAMDLHKAVAFKTMHHCEEIIYHYWTGDKNTPQEIAYAKSLGL